MHDTEGVRRFQRDQDLTDVVASKRGRELAFTIEHGRKRLSLEELHHHEHRTVFRSADVTYVDDVRTVNLSCDLGFLQKPVDEARAVEKLPVENLDRHVRPKHFVDGLEDGPHSAVADLALEPVFSSEEGADCHR